MNETTTIIVASVVLVAIWWIAGYFTINPDQFAYITRFGKFIKVKEPGLKHALWPIDKVTKLPALGLQVLFERIGVVTHEENFLGKDRGETLIGVDIVMNFQFFNDSTIEKTINFLGDPPNIDNLVNILEEPVQTALRAQGEHLCWLEMFIKRGDASEETRKELLKNPNGPLCLANLKNVSFSIKHIEVEKKLLESINEPEVQRMLMEASKSEAERARIMLAGKGKGDAEAREAIFKVAEKYPEMERLLTMREMAQGPATTIFIPREILTALESYTGKPMGNNEEVVNLLKQLLGKFPS